MLMKKCIITALVVLLCASSVYAGGKKETSPSAPASVPEKKPATTASSTTTGRQVTQEEIDLHKKAGGSSCDYSNITVVEGQMPTVENIRAEAAVGSQTIDKVSDKELNDKISSSDAMTLPSGTIYTKDPITEDPKDKALMSHEIEHVAQYQNDDAGKVFDRIVTETQNGNPYNTPGTLENDAQKVQDRAEEILKGNVK